MTGFQFDTSFGNLDLSFKAENDLSAKQYFIVEMSAEDQVDVCDNAGIGEEGFSAIYIV